MKTIFKNGKIITSSKIIDNGIIIVNDTKIEKILTGKQKNIYPNDLIIDAGNNYISPGFIDIHTHGGGGHDFMDGTLESLISGCKTHLEHGTTSIVPTTTTGTLDEIFNIFDIIKEAKYCTDYQNILGLHLEGPYISQEQRGAQDPEYIKKPNKKEYLKILNYTDAIIRWTVAPELPGSIELGDELISRKILPCIGHSDATYEEVLKAFNHGYKHITHFYSCCSTVKRVKGYRYAGIIESAYLIDDITVEIIADGKHLPPSLLKLIYKIKGPDRICLVTDSMRAAGTSVNKSIIGSLAKGKEVIIEDGVAKLPSKEAFAGSIATADILVKNILRLTNVPMVDTIKMITLTPAKIIGLDKKKGSIAEGKDADIIIFDDNIDIKLVMVGGKTIINKL